MKGIHIYQLLIIGLFCSSISTSLLANINQEKVCINIPFSKTVLLDKDEIYHEGICNDTVLEYTLIDSSCTITDTLCGNCWYLLYFDTTILAEGIELQRTEDSLCLIYHLNRNIASYRTIEIPSAPREILVADSLIKSALCTKRIWMDRLTPYYASCHSILLSFTIIPLNKFIQNNIFFGEDNDTIFDSTQTVHKNRKKMQNGKNIKI